MILKCGVRTKNKRYSNNFRYYDIAFYAYSPLGGGILTGKYKFEENENKAIAKGRFNGIGWDKVIYLLF